MGQRISRLFVGALILGAASFAGADNWPQFRGPHRDGISRETGLYRSWPAEGPKVLWSVPLGPGYAGPAIYDGWVYVNDYDEKTNEWMVRCLSLKDGQERWRFREAKRIRPNHLITRTVPAVDGQYVFSLDPKCVLHCLDAASGKQLWQKNLPKEYHSRIPPWYAGQCPLVEETRLLIATGGDALAVALDKPTGQEIWRTPNPKKWQMSHASLMPAELGGVKQYVYCTLRGLQGIAADDGRLLWYHPAKFNLAVAPSPLPIGEDLVFMTSLYNADSLMIRVTRDGGQFQSQRIFRMPPSYWNSEIHTPILYEDHLFAVGKKRRGLFTCLDLNGKIVWDSNRHAYFGLGSYLLADGMFFVLEGRTGMLRLLEANTKQYRELAHAQVLSGHDVWAPMALSDGKLVLRDVTKMVCLEVGPASEQASR
ncbi:MAG TPA: polyvinylalcohol dehydrogenase [Planctomycetaceae bacterium]|nr:polyvinylalcohol dehydrogenase [Planctomycetaceae bacterium]